MYISEQCTLVNNKFEKILPLFCPFTVNPFKKGKKMKTLCGDVSKIQGDVSNIFGYVSKIQGDVSNISGDVSKIRQ